MIKLLYSLYNFIFSNDIEKFSANLIQNLKKKNHTIIVIDIGCYTGNFSKKINQNLSNTDVLFYMIDPNKNVLPSLNKLGIKKKFFSYAIDSDSNYRTLFFNNFFPASGTSLSDIYYKSKGYNISRNLFFLFRKKNFFSKKKVKTISLDKFIKTEKIKKIDILKIDTEGNEENILLSSKYALEKTKVLTLELLSKKADEKEKFNKINNFLKKKNFILKYKKRIYSTSIFTNLICYDLIYLNCNK
jgi:FkbM family methyltransferase